MSVGAVESTTKAELTVGVTCQLSAASFPIAQTRYVASAATVNVKGCVMAFAAAEASAVVSQLPEVY